MRHWFHEAALAVAVPWVLARVVVAGGYALARVAVDELDVDRPPSLADGLGSWDAHHHRVIAEDGYDALPDGFRFFPLFPLTVRALRPVFLGSTTAAQVVIANVAAFALGIVLYRLTLHETGNARTARITVWFVLLCPAAVPVRNERTVWSTTAAGAAGLLAYATAIFLGAKVP